MGNRKLKKGVIIAAAVILCLLAGAFFLQDGGDGGNEDGNGLREPVSEEMAEPDDGLIETEAEAVAGEAGEPAGDNESPTESPDEAGCADRPESSGKEGILSSAASQKSEATDGKLTCTMSIRCATVLDNMDRLPEGQKSVIPADGWMLKQVTAEFEQGDSVFDVLQRELRARGMHLEFSTSPLYGSAYIEGICNLYEFDCGELSGWEYAVNGAFPGYGCSKYTLSDGDRIAWVYTCDGGNDIGGKQ